MPYFKSSLLGLSAIALLIPTAAIAQISSRCSELKNIYVLARKTYSFNVSGSCLNDKDGMHSPFLTKEAYDALETKPNYNFFID